MATDEVRRLRPKPRGMLPRTSEGWSLRNRLQTRGRMSKGDAGTRQQRRAARAFEQRARTKDRWGSWERTPLPHGIPGASLNGWTSRVREVAKNQLYVVLIRPLLTEWGLIHHLAIRTASGLEPPWRDKQRIKNELFDPEFAGLEALPPHSRTVDAADMYHIWIMPVGKRFPFGIGATDDD